MRLPLAFALLVAVLASGCEKASPCEDLNVGQDPSTATCRAAEYVQSNEDFLSDSETWPVSVDIKGSGGLPGHVAERPDGTRLAGSEWGLSWTVPAGDPNAESVVDRIRRETVRTDSIGHVVRVALSPDGSYALGFHDGRMIVRDPSDAGRLETQPPVAPQTVGDYEYPNRFSAVSFSGSGANLALGDDIGTLEVWDVARGEMAWSQALDVKIQSLTFTEDGSRLAVGTGAGSLILMDGQTGESLTTWTLPGAVLRTRIVADSLIAARTRGGFTSASDVRDQAQRMGETSNLAPGVSGVVGPDLVSLWRIPGP